MPSINIREIDVTGAATQDYIENVALLPVPKMVAYDTDENKYTIDGLYQTKDAFEVQLKKLFTLAEEEQRRIIKPTESGESGEEPQLPEWAENILYIKANITSDYVFVMIEKLLMEGMPVQVGGLYSYEDGTGRPQAEEVDIDAFYEEYEDRGTFDIKFVTPGSLYNDTLIGSIVNKACIKCAAERGDAIACISVDDSYASVQELDEQIQEGYKNYCTNVPTRTGVTWTDGTTTTEKYGNYTAMFVPNIITGFEIKDSNNTITYKYSNIVIPAYFQYLLSYVNMVGRGKPDWFAVAGSERGSSGLSFVPVIEMGDKQANILSPRDGGDDDVNEGHVCSNAIRNIRPFGYIIYGARTMHPLSRPNGKSELPVQLIASDFLNIRSLCCDLKKTLYRAARAKMFDPNTDTLWFNFKALVTPLLERMKSEQGIRGYKIIKKVTSKKAVLSAKLAIIPVEPVEDFDLTVELTDDIAVEE